MLAVEKVVLFIIFLIVLLVSFIIMFEMSKGSADKLLLQNELRQCCGTFRAYECKAATSTIFCNDKTIEDLRVEIGLTPGQLETFCACP